MARLEAEGAICADHSTVVHRFDDGWTVNRLQTMGDLRREGQLMRSCLAQYAGDTLDPKVPALVIERSAMDDSEPHGWDEASSLAGDSPEIWATYLLSSLHSLRDETGLPHATWWQRDQLCAFEILGYRNSKLRPAYRQRIDAWMQASNVVPLPVEMMREHMLSPATAPLLGLLQSEPELGERIRALELIMIFQTDMNARVRGADDPEADDLLRALDELVRTRTAEIMETAGAAA
jgi:hypothetical protein